jgi:hypothetical protein
VINLEEIKNLEKMAEENSNLAKIEKDSATEMKALAKQTVKRAKAREMLVENEIDLVKIREKLAEKSKRLVEKKEKVKGLLNISEEALKAEEIQATYNEKVAEVQTKIAEIQGKIANVETEIAEVKVKIAKKKLNQAKNRGNLAKKQLNYIKLVNNNAPSEKISKAKEAYLNEQKDLTKLETDAVRLNKNIVEKQNKLADLKKILSDELAEREKIRPEETT